MSEADRRRWDAHYLADAGRGPRDAAALGRFAPHASALPDRGDALEIACGCGRAAWWLARRGLRVHAVDVSPVAIHRARTLAGQDAGAGSVRFDVFDLDRGLPPGPPVALLLCCGFRDPRLYQALAARLAPGGLLALSVLSEVGVGPGRFRAVAGELQRAFGMLELLAEGEGGGHAWLLGRRQDGPVPRVPNSVGSSA